MQLIFYFYQTNGINLYLTYLFLKLLNKNNLLKHFLHFHSEELVEFSTLKFPPLNSIGNGDINHPFPTSILTYFTAFAISLRETLTCLPVSIFFNEYKPVFLSSSPTIIT